MSTFKDVSDGYHTFGELYAHRHALTLNLMKELSTKAWFSKFHDDGTMFEGNFIVGIDLPSGMITYHLPLSLYDYAKKTKATELARGKKYDGHTPDDVIKRLMSNI